MDWIEEWEQEATEELGGYTNSWWDESSVLFEKTENKVLNKAEKSHVSNIGRIIGEFLKGEWNAIKCFI